jgi:hypothetical protein
MGRLPVFCNKYYNICGLFDLAMNIGEKLQLNAQVETHHEFAKAAKKEQT